MESGFLQNEVEFIRDGIKVSILVLMESGFLPRIIDLMASHWLKFLSLF